MAEVSFSLADKFGFARQLGENVERSVGRQARSITSIAAGDMRAILRRRSPVSKAPNHGALQRGWSVVPGLSALEFQIKNDVPYLQYVMRGHGWIYPRTAKALRFQVWPSGEVVFARRVRPVPPNRFVEESVVEFQSSMHQNWMARINE